MNLRDYLHFERMTIKKMAQTLDISPSHLGNYIAGRIRLSKKVARNIEKFTQGKVTAAEVIQANPPKKKVYKK